jgi:hypothetical protein
MADMVVVGYRTQALALPDGFPLLVRSQLWLGPEFDTSFLVGGGGRKCSMPYLSAL